MLTAYDKKRRQLVSLFDQSFANLQRLKAKKWFCPACQQPVILKLGSLKIPHFAHCKGQSCNYEAEAETPEHLALKRLFAKWCHKESLPVEVEPYLPSVKQRPDLLLGQLALEIQCSPLSLRRFRQRTQAYHQAGYQVIWLCGAKLFSAKQLTELNRQMCYYSRQLGFYLWQANWQQETLTLFFHIEETQTHQLYASQKTWSFYQNSLMEVLNYPENNQLFVQRNYSLEVLLQAYYHKILQQFSYKNKYLGEIQYYLYQQQYHILYLPEWFYYPGLRLFPVKHSDLYLKFKVWQSLKQLPSKTHSKAALIRRINNSIAQEVDSLRSYPNISICDVLRYCTQCIFIWLLNCQIIRPDKNNYRVVLPECSSLSLAFRKLPKNPKFLNFISTTPAKL